MAKNKSYDTADMLSGFVSRPKTEEVVKTEQNTQIKEVNEKAEETATGTNYTKETTKKVEKRTAPQKVEKTTTIKAPIFTAPAKENKSKATSILLRPSLHEKVKQKCDEEHISFNELINQMLEWWLTQ